MPVTDRPAQPITRLTVLLDRTTSTAEHTLPWAALLARTLNIPLTLLHIVDPARISEPAEVGIAEASDYLALVASSLETSVAVSTEVRQGLASEEWADISRQQPGTALMLSNGNMGGVGAVFMGDPIGDPIKAIVTPVIVVPASPAATSETKRIVVGNDGGHASRDALGFAQALATRFEAELIEVEAIERGSRPDHELLQMAPQISGSRIALRGPAGPSVLAVARARQADLIVVGARSKRGVFDALLGSTSDWLVRNSDRPVIIAPEPWLSPQEPRKAT